MSDREKKLQEARRHASTIAMGLVALLGTIDGAGVVFGAGIGELTNHLGSAKAREYLQGILDCWDDDGPWPDQAANN